MIKFIDSKGIIRDTVPDALIDRLEEIGQCLANKHKSTICATKGGLTKLRTFQPQEARS